MTGKTITAEEFDRRFDDGEDVDEYMDWSTARRPGLETTEVKIEILKDVVRRINFEAAKQGKTTEALMAEWLNEKLDKAA